MDDVTCAAVQLYNGETRYGDAQREECVKQLLVHPDAKRGAVDMVIMRGMMHRFAYSQLEEIVRQCAADE